MLPTQYRLVHCKHHPTLHQLTGYSILPDHQRGRFRFFFLNGLNFQKNASGKRLDATFYIKLETHGLNAF